MLLSQRAISPIPPPYDDDTSRRTRPLSASALSRLVISTYHTEHSFLLPRIPPVPIVPPEPSAHTDFSDQGERHAILMEVIADRWLLSIYDEGTIHIWDLYIGGATPASTYRRAGLTPDAKCCFSLQLPIVDRLSSAYATPSQDYTMLHIALASYAHIMFDRKWEVFDNGVHQTNGLHSTRRVPVRDVGQRHYWGPTATSRCKAYLETAWPCSYRSCTPPSFRSDVPILLGHAGGAPMGEREDVATAYDRANERGRICKSSLAMCCTCTPAYFVVVDWCHSCEIHIRVSYLMHQVTRSRAAGLTEHNHVRTLSARPCRHA